jgi:hypothetical protein
MRVLLALVFMIAGIVFGPVSSANAQDISESPPYPLPGRLVDVGGWRLHLNCTGVIRATQPTVILEAGLGLSPPIRRI